MSSTNTTKDLGALGENKALKYLLEEGYTLLDKNYRYKRSEIDLIVQKKSTLVFVEVKFRKTSIYGHPEEFVSPNQQRSILEGAEQFIIDQDWEGNIRFDIIAVNANLQIEHFEDAFY